MFYITFFTTKTKLSLVSDGLEHTRESTTTKTHTQALIHVFPQRCTSWNSDAYSAICVTLTKKKKKKGGKEASINFTWCILVCRYSGRTHELIHVSIQICLSSHSDTTVISLCPKSCQSTEKNHVQAGFKVWPVNKKIPKKKLKSKPCWRPMTFRSVHPKQNKNIF